MITLLILCCLTYVNAGDDWPPPSDPPDPPPEEPPGPMPLEPMKRIFIRLPSVKQVLDIDTFKTQVEGETFSWIYSILDSSDEMIPLRFRSRTSYSLLNRKDIMFDSTFRSSPTAECDEEVGAHFGRLIGRGKHLALDTGRTTASGLTIPRRTYFISRRPEDYLILVTCDRSSIVRRRRICKRDFRVDILVKQDPPTTVNWFAIEKELRRCVGSKLADKRNTFLYLGEDGRCV